MSYNQPPGGSPPPPPPGGGYPPQPPGGGYPPQQPPGGMPPPPPGGGGYPPQPPPGGGMPMGPGGPSNGPDIGAAISWAFTKFGQNAAVLLVFAAVILVINVIRYFVDRAFQPVLISGENCDALINDGEAYLNCLNNTTTASVASIAGFGVASLLISLLFFILTLLATIGLINASLKITRGEKPSFADYWSPQHAWVYIAVSIIYSLSLVLGVFVFCVGFLIVMWIWQFAQFSALDGHGIGGSLGESYKLVMANKGAAVVVLLVNFLATVVTAVTCGIGALVALPFQMLFTANMYRQFQKVPIAP